MPHPSDYDLALNLPFSEEREAYLAECREHYASYPVDVSELEQELEQWVQAHTKASSYAVKARVYELVAQRCPVKIFRHSPFYHELVSGRERDSWGFGGVGGWMYHRNYPAMTRHLHEQTDPWTDDGICMSNYFDIDHHCAGYDKLLRLGLRGIASEAEERLATASEEEAEFLRAVIAGQQAGICLAERMREEAACLAQQEDDSRIKARLELIADTAPGN